MPSAQGLPHRAAVQSASTLTLANREAGTRNAGRLLARLGLSTRRIAELRDVPVEILVATPPAQSAPIVDGVAIPRDPTLVLGDTTTVESDPPRRFRLLWAELAG
jgi:para-nitrobenzyl esterase